MEFVTGYRDSLVDFTDAMFRWYRAYLVERGAAESLAGREDRCAGLPVDAASPRWILHVLGGSGTGQAQPLDERLLEDSEALLSADELRSYVSTSNTQGAPQPRLLFVTDEHGALLGFEFGESGGGDEGRALQEIIRGLLCRCMETPLSGGEPRRPENLAVGDAEVHCYLLLPLLPLSLFRCVSPFPPYSVKCRAVFYCSEKCKKIDWKKSPDDVSHQNWCSKLQSYMCALRHDQVTSDTFDQERFLSSRALNCGYWVKQSMLVQAFNYELLPFWDPSTECTPACLRGRMNPYDPLKKEGRILMQTVPVAGPSVKAPLASWSDYYKWRGFDLDSPVAALLSYPLTIYYIITSLAPRHFPELNILNKQSLKIHIIEGAKEFSMLLVFWELSVLLPHVAFEIHFVGEALPKEADEQQAILQRKDGHVTLVHPNFVSEEKTDKRIVRVKGYSRPYHMLQGPKPDLVIGFNCGFGLSDTWISSLPRLQSLRVPAYFSECSEYSCAVSQLSMSTATGGSVSEAGVNPFRSPLRVAGGDNNMPWYSNAFLFHLIYKVAQNGKREQQQAQNLQRPHLVNPHNYTRPQQSNHPTAGSKPRGSEDSPPDSGKRTRKEKKQARNAGRRRKQ
ncbi:zinc finger MYND domain-containing protein 15-like [Polyodon spathula]|uniref:zinc finger MYND domain-containing protein 15-like n=1 Tax=Polyodon spathula TaxID=7913 RepID=UPI001B7E8BD8|nr:zinc finger MYND domain-containing protein 15-like [Polyodon spathula]